MAAVHLTGGGYMEAVHLRGVVSESNKQSFIWRFQASTKRKCTRKWRRLRLMTGKRLNICNSGLSIDFMNNPGWNRVEMKVLFQA